MPTSQVIDIPLLEAAIQVMGGDEMAAESKSLPFKKVLWLKLSFKSKSSRIHVPPWLCHTAPQSRDFNPPRDPPLHLERNPALASAGFLRRRWPVFLAVSICLTRYV